MNIILINLQRIRQGKGASRESGRFYAAQGAAEAGERTQRVRNGIITFLLFFLDIWQLGG